MCNFISWDHEGIRNKIGDQERIENIKEVEGYQVIKNVLQGNCRAGKPVFIIRGDLSHELCQNILAVHGGI